MANISVSAQCNRSCSYCFAMESLDQIGAGDTFMPLASFERALDFLDRSGIREARVLGGEPTIHPCFVDMVAMVLARGLQLLVFSGGFIPPRALNALAAAPADKVRVLVNALSPQHAAPRELARQAEVYRRLGPRVALGLNIISPAVEFDFLLTWIAEYGLARVVRLGLAHPIANGNNQHLHPRHYPEVGRRVAEFGLRARECGIGLSFDCGWVPCMFPDGALAALGLGPTEVGLRCNPILDLLPDGTVISCYPLAGHAREPLTGDVDATALRTRFAAHQKEDRQLMLYAHCSDCEWRARGECTGGCLAASLNRLRQAEFSFLAPGGGEGPERSPQLPTQ